jgi:hypothetical protein
MASHLFLLLEREFEITDDNAREQFIARAKQAQSLSELPKMTASMQESIAEGMKWAEQQRSRGKNEDKE